MHVGQELRMSRRSCARRLEVVHVKHVQNFTHQSSSVRNCLKMRTSVKSCARQLNIWHVSYKFCTSLEIGARRTVLSSWRTGWGGEVGRG